MQRERDHRERERVYDRERDYAHDVRERDRYHPATAQHPSSLMHVLPPIAHARGYYPPSPGMNGSRSDMPPSTPGHPEPSGWGGGGRRGSGIGPAGSPVIPSSELRGRPGRWSPPPSSRSPPRHFDRLPSLVDYTPVPGRGHGAPPRTGHGLSAPPPPPPRHWDAPPPPPFHPEVAKDDVSLISNPPVAEIFDDGSAAAAVSHIPAVKHAAPPSDEVQPRKKKRRQAFSCIECAKRKQKCNRQTPCQHCVSRKVEALCISSQEARERALAASAAGAGNDSASSSATRAKPKVDAPERKPASNAVDEPTPSSTGAAAAPTLSLSTRVNKLERMLNAMLNRVEGVESSALTEWRQHHPMAASPRPIRPPLDPLGGPAQSASSSSASWIDRTLPGQRDKLPNGAAGALGVDFDGTVGDRLNHIIEDGPLTALHKALRDLPPKDFSDKLVDFFFELSNLQYPIDQRRFRQIYDDVYSSQVEGTGLSVLGLPLVFAVLSSAMRFAPVDWAGPDDMRNKRSRKYYWIAHITSGLATAVDARNIQLVETRILLGQHIIMLGDHRLKDAWLMLRSAVGQAMSLGLHHESSRHRFDAHTVEYRRRLWSYLCHADATLSSLVGLPLSIDPTLCSTPSPSNITLEELAAGAETVPKPLHKPTSSTFLIVRKRFSEIVARIVNIAQRRNLSVDRFEDVVSLNKELVAFRDDLPPFFRMDSDEKYDNAYKDLKVHRYYVQLDILYQTVILHRSWFLRRIHNDEYGLSRNAMWEAVVAIGKLRKAFINQGPDCVTNLSSSLSDLDVAIIAAIGLLVDPTSKHASDMKSSVSSFMQTPVSSLAGQDASQKEMTIVKTLYKRAMELRCTPAQAPLPLASPSHPLDNLSSERGGPPSFARGTTRMGSLNDGTDSVFSALREDDRRSATELNDDRLQALFDFYLDEAENDYRSGIVDVGHGYLHISASSSTIGVTGITPSLDANEASVFSPEYWDNFANVVDGMKSVETQNQA